MLKAAAAVAALAIVATAAAATSRREQIASPSECTSAPARLSYSWPVKPFWRQHPVRGNFGDPRTVFRGRGFFAFHNGVDIVAPDWSRVYPVASGRVIQASPDEIIVASSEYRRFQYWHLYGVVGVGDWVTARRTVLGFVQPTRHHVHLSEIRDGIVQNPLASGHLLPYHDRRPPVVDSISLQAESGAKADPAALRGKVGVVVAAHDAQTMPVPGVWNGFPVAPAALSWRLTTPDGRAILPERVAVDFRATEPADEEFWQVYARGTRQNFATVGDRYLYQQPGHYLFNLTPAPIDTGGLPAGDYVLTVTASDVCGNTGSLSEAIRVLPHPEPAPPPAPPSPTTTTPSVPVPAPRPHELVRWPRAQRGYTVVLASVPDAAGRKPALETARRALAAGLPAPGVLHSRDFSSLRPGYYVAFSGAYPPVEYAIAAAARAARIFPGANARPVAAPMQLTHWPHGRAGFTVVLQSLPKSAGYAAARAEAQRAADAGVRHVGVLVSGRYSSLQPGYYVVFSGVYRSSRAAQLAAPRVSTAAPGAYPREITP